MEWSHNTVTYATRRVAAEDGKRALGGRAEEYWEAG